MNFKTNIEDSSWQNLLADIFETDWFAEIEKKIAQEIEQYTVYPPKDLFFNAMNLCSVDKTRVVILGQDPYSDAGQAHGLSFSVPYEIDIPNSLQNIYKELERDTDPAPTINILEILKILVQTIAV